MKLRNSIFDSNSEAAVFRSLQTRWSPKLKLYPSIPFSKILQPDPEELTPKELDFFYKTNVDYTFCRPNGHPILSIEFDGIGGGFSRDGVYLPARETSDPYRELKMDFKLKAAKDTHYPFVVVSYEEAKTIDEEESLTILDGIVGQVLARHERETLLSEFIETSKDKIDGMREDMKHEYFQDLVIDAEVMAELDVDPIAKKAAQYSMACVGTGFSHSTEYLCEPPLPEITGFFDVEGLKARIEAMKHAVRIGCRIIIKTPKSPIVQIVWLRNFEGFGINPPSIAENIAEYLAFKRAILYLKAEEDN